MKRKLLSLLCLIVLTVGLALLLFCGQLWLKILGIIIAVVTIVLGIDFFTDDF